VGTISFKTAEYSCHQTKPEESCEIRHLVVFLKQSQSKNSEALRTINS